MERQHIKFTSTVTSGKGRRGNRVGEELLRLCALMKRKIKHAPALRGTGTWVEILAEPLVGRGDWWAQDTLVLGSSEHKQ